MLLYFGFLSVFINFINFHEKLVLLLILLIFVILIIYLMILILILYINIYNTMLYINILRLRIEFLSGLLFSLECRLLSIQFTIILLSIEINLSINPDYLYFYCKETPWHICFVR